MSTWFEKVTTDLSELPAAIAYFESQLLDARKETSLKGNLEMNSRLMPGIVEHRFNQLQEIEAILEYLNIQLRKKRSQVLKKYMENYNRQLTSRDAEKYSDGDDEVVEWQLLINEFAMIRNKYLGLMKAIDSKQFQINNITKLRVAGMEDTTLGQYFDTNWLDLYNLTMINDTLKWLGCALVCVGALANSLGYSQSFWLLNLGALSYLIWAYRVRDKNLVIVNAVVLAAWSVGLIRQFV